MPMSARDLREVQGVHDMFMARDNWGDLYEEITFSLYTSVLGDGDCAADCGTNYGLHTRAIARACGNNGKVFAFEAAPQMMDVTKQKNESFSNILYFNNALWNEAGQKKTFNFYPNETGLSSLSERAGTSEHLAFDVVTTTLDASVDAALSLIKLDIEGAEYHALCGARRIMQEDRPVIVFENDRRNAADRFGYSTEDFFGLFESCGYHLYTIAGMPLVRENWDAPSMPWQFMAVHPQSPRASRAFAVTQNYIYRLRSNI